jgi:hypothetical protein
MCTILHQRYVDYLTNPNVSYDKANWYLIQKKWVKALNNLQLKEDVEKIMKILADNWRRKVPVNATYKVTDLPPNKSASASAPAPSTPAPASAPSTPASVQDYDFDDIQFAPKLPSVTQFHYFYGYSDKAIAYYIKHLNAFKQMYEKARPNFEKLGAVSHQRVVDFNSNPDLPLEQTKFYILFEKLIASMKSK